MDQALLERVQSGGDLREFDASERLLIKRTVYQAVEALPQRLRMAIRLREIEGLSYEEIAQAMKCPSAAVRSMLLRAREAIDQRLSPLLRRVERPK